MFIDEVEITAGSGKGGAGSVSFLRTMLTPRGGPDGGNGGRGGALIFVADTSMNTLIDYHYERSHFAENGKPGASENRSGRSGKDKTLKVPVGTMIYDLATGEQLADLTETGASFTLAEGGRGGRGNASFATSRNRAPRYAQPGEAGAKFRLRLVLKLIADVGLIGMPNVGKSTLIARISKARPKIADYPFTTLVPNLGVVQTHGTHPFVVADVPGLIPGASTGAGLGHQFLRHVERTRLLVHMLDAASERDPAEDYAAIRHELGEFNPELLERPEMIVLSRIDAANELDGKLESLKKVLKKRAKVYKISAHSGEGIDKLIQAISLLLFGKEKD